LLAGVNVCCVCDTSSLDFMHAIDETVEGVGGLHPCLFFSQKMCSCARFFRPIRLLLAWKLVGSLGMECLVEIEKGALLAVVIQHLWSSGCDGGRVQGCWGGFGCLGFHGERERERWSVWLEGGGRGLRLS
jgi:hypothetical protein